MRTLYGRFALIALAALFPDQAPQVTPRSRNLEMLVPVLFGLVPIGVLVTGALQAERMSRFAVGLAVAALATVAVRTALAIREVVALSDQRRRAYLGLAAEMAG